MSVKELKVYRFRCDKCADTERTTAQDHSVLPEGWESWVYDRTKKYYESNRMYYNPLTKHYCFECANGYDLKHPGLTWKGWTEFELRTTETSRGRRSK